MSSGLFGLPNPLQVLRAMALSVTGKPGAVAGAGLAGGTTSGAPTTGAFSLGDAVVDQTGQLWICTVAGSPGTWVASAANASNITAGTLAQARGGTGIDTSGATNGQLLIGKTSDHTLNLATLTAGSNVTITNGAGAVTIASTASASLTGATVLLSADVACTNANQFYDGPTTGTLAAGTYLIMATVTVKYSSQDWATAKLWDGTTALVSTENFGATTPLLTSLSLSAVVSASGSQAFKVSVACANAGRGTIAAATVHNGAGNNATSITYVKIA